MRRLPLLLFGVLCCVRPCFGQAKTDATTETLVRACEAAVQYPSWEEIQKAPVARQAAISFDASYCAAYFAGILDLNSLYTGMFPTFFCPPKEGLTPEEAIKIFLAYTKDHAGFLTEKARSIAVSALADILPCR